MREGFCVFGNGVEKNAGKSVYRGMRIIADCHLGGFWRGMSCRERTQDLSCRERTQGLSCWQRWRDLLCRRCRRVWAYPLRLLCAAVFLALCAVFSACMYVEEGSDRGGLRVSFLDVGQGLAVLLEEDGRYALFDTGPDSAGLVDTLAARGVRELEWVLVSHAHRDHGGGFMEFARAVESGALRVGRLYVGPDTYAGIVRDSVLRLASRFKERGECGRAPGIWRLWRAADGGSGFCRRAEVAGLFSVAPCRCFAGAASRVGGEQLHRVPVAGGSAVCRGERWCEKRLRAPGRTGDAQALLCRGRFFGGVPHRPGW